MSPKAVYRAIGLAGGLALAGLVAAQLMTLLVAVILTIILSLPLSAAASVARAPSGPAGGGRARGPPRGLRGADRPRVCSGPGVREPSQAVSRPTARHHRRRGALHPWPRRGADTRPVGAGHQLRPRIRRSSSKAGRPDRGDRRDGRRHHRRAGRDRSRGVPDRAQPGRPRRGPSAAVARWAAKRSPG